MFVSELAMFASRSCVLLGFFVLAESVVMLGLMMMMMRSGVVVTGRQVMMLTRPDALATVPFVLPPLSRLSLGEPKDSRNNNCYDFGMRGMTA